MKMFGKDLDCSMQTNNSKNAVLTNFIWRFAERCGAQIIQFIVSLLLARILNPEAYGTVALVVVITQILQVFVDSGLGNALIQKKDADDIDFSSVFFFNVAGCLILYCMIFVAAPYIARFFEDDSLTSVIRVLCFVVVVSGLRNVQNAYISKHMLFKKFFFATLIGTVTSAAVGIVMALQGYGVWSLVMQKLVSVLVDTVVLWLIVEWRPKLSFSFERLKSLISYGWKLLVSSLIDTLYTNLRTLLIGKVYNEKALAFYNRGEQFSQIIALNMNASIDSVLLPAMAKEQNDRERVKNMTRRSIKTSTYIMAPLMIGLFVVAPTVVELILTEKWIESVPYLQIFCLTYMFYPIHTANLNAIKSLGRSDLFLRLEIYKKCVGIIILVIVLPHGVLAMAYSAILTSIICQLINASPNKNLLKYGYFEQMKDILPAIGLACVMGVLIHPLSLVIESKLLLLIAQVLVGAVIYILGSVVFRLESFNYLWGIINSIIVKQRK